MPPDLVETFAASLEDLGVTWSRTTADGFTDALAEAVEEPAVGAALPFDGVSLPGFVTAPPTPDLLRRSRTGVTAAGAGIAEYGTVVIQSRPDGDEPASLYPERHVAVLRESDLLPDLSAATGWLADEFAAGRDTAVLASGVSATADMGESVRGVHGPHEVHVLLLSDR